MKYHIITYGCQLNKSDSEKIAPILEESGYQPTSKENMADLIVVNMCSVRQSAVNRAYSKINKYYKAKKIILAGCILQADKKNLKDKVAEFWHPDKYFECSPAYQNKVSAFVPIMTGCNNFCAYCVVPYTRGREVSRKAEKIIKEIKSLIKEGYSQRDKSLFHPSLCSGKEIILLGQNVNSYKDSDINFPKLLKKVNDIKGVFQLSFITSHPKDISDELIEIMANCEKLIPYLHLPVQSGDNQVLKKMNRYYTADQYKNLIKKLRQKIPGIKISTDIIVGFPNETRKQFQNTLKLCKEIKFDKAYIAKYSPRPGTSAFKLKDIVPLQEKKHRWQILEKLINKKHVKKGI